jgi:rRNA maturation endonuclease Nob1
MDSRAALVLDTSAFIAGFNPSAVDAELFSVPEVEQELAPVGLPKVRFSSAVELGKLKLIQPKAVFLKKVEEASKQVGDFRFLSEADTHILALALQLKAEGKPPTIVTDDYSIQNVAGRIDVSHTPLTTFGIKFYLKWTLYCPACRKKYPSDHKSATCSICGTALKRKPEAKIASANSSKSS